MKLLVTFFVISFLALIGTTLQAQDIDRKYIKKYIKSYDRLNGKKLPDFQLEDVNGEIVNLQEFKGKVIYINFWSTTCGPCIAEIPYARRMQERNADEDFVYLNICLDSTKESWKNIVSNKNNPGVNLFTESNFLHNYFKIKWVPNYMAVDTQGKVQGYDISSPSELLMPDFILYKVSQGLTAKQAATRLLNNDFSKEDVERVLILMEKLKVQQENTETDN